MTLSHEFMGAVTVGNAQLDFNAPLNGYPSSDTKTVTIGAGESYNVKRGDTLWKIANRPSDGDPPALNKQVADRVDQIAQANNIPNGNLIKMGQDLYIPYGQKGQ
jgi:nucleoid-associated protein YgaU